VMKIYLKLRKIERLRICAFIAVFHLVVIVKMSSK
jgi:hypothetical protein